ncbi:MAG: hypothetical protein MUE46_09370 [Xanthomonadales bacterium]|jgi:hypothetical protein|nr:hypothetical protein [Xanthomonadales bacterium]
MPPDAENWDLTTRAYADYRWHAESEAPTGVPVLDLAVLRGVHGREAQAAALSELAEAVTASGFVVRPPMGLHAGSARDVLVFFQAPPLNSQLKRIEFNDAQVGAGSIFDELYQAAGDEGHVRFSQLRVRLFGEFIRQMEARDAQAEAEEHLFSTV